MKTYDRKETTPLAFYKFFNYGWVPFGFFGCIISLAFVLASKYPDWYRQFLTVTDIALLIGYVFMFIGLLRWQPYALAFLALFLGIALANFAVNIVYNLTLPASVYKTVNVAAAIVLSAVSIALYGVVVCYFYKRRLLFDGVPYKIPPNSGRYYPPPVGYYPGYYAAAVCPYCGAPRPVPAYAFCPNCGNRYDA